jgi:CheY-like chemotaxis protein
MIGKAKILAISEDTDVRNLILCSLEFEGHKATCVTSPHEALQLLRRGLVADILLIHAAKDRSKELSLFRRFGKKSAAKNCASSPSREIRQRQNRRFIRCSEGKCEPVYTNHTACVALWTRQRRQPAILRDLQLFRLVWKLHPCDGNESKGLLALPGYRTALDNPLCKPAGLNAPHTTIGTGPDFPKMIFRAAPSAIRFERGGRVGAFMFKVSETQGSIGNHLLCALQKELARLRLRDMLCK